MRVRFHPGSIAWRCALTFVVLLPVGAMDLLHYDLDSLVYLSTDIVLADISKDTSGKFTASVTEALYGSLQPGVKLDTLTPFLEFFPADGRWPKNHFVS